MFLNFTTLVCMLGLLYAFTAVFFSLMIIMIFIFQIIFQNKIVQRREEEYNKLKKEREEKIKNLINARRAERDGLRKMIFYLRTEEERLTKLQEEEEARKREGRFNFRTFCIRGI